MYEKKIENYNNNFLEIYNETFDLTKYDRFTIEYYEDFIQNIEFYTVFKKLLNNVNFEFYRIYSKKNKELYFKLLKIFIIFFYLIKLLKLYLLKIIILLISIFSKFYFYYIQNLIKIFYIQLNLKNKNIFFIQSELFNYTFNSVAINIHIKNKFILIKKNYLFFLLLNMYNSSYLNNYFSEKKNNFFLILNNILIQLSIKNILKNTFNKDFVFFFINHLLIKFLFTTVKLNKLEIILFNDFIYSKQIKFIFFYITKFLILPILIMYSNLDWQFYRLLFLKNLYFFIINGLEEKIKVININYILNYYSLSNLFDEYYILSSFVYSLYWNSEYVLLSYSYFFFDFESNLFIV